MWTLDAGEPLGDGHRGHDHLGPEASQQLCRAGLVPRGVHRRDARWPDTAPGEHRGARLPTVRTTGRSKFSIEDIAEAGITVGCGGTRYCPNRAVTRGQMASFITRALDLPPSPTTGSMTTTTASTTRRLTASPSRDHQGVPQRDLPAESGGHQGSDGELPGKGARPAALPDDWFGDDDNSVHDEAIDSIAEAGITVGFSDGTFRPEEPVTRAQMASFLDGGSSNDEKDWSSPWRSPWW